MTKEQPWHTASRGKQLVFYDQWLRPARGGDRRVKQALSADRIGFAKDQGQTDSVD